MSEAEDRAAWYAKQRAEKENANKPVDTKEWYAKEKAAKAAKTAKAAQAAAQRRAKEGQSQKAWVKDKYGGTPSKGSTAGKSSGLSGWAKGVTSRTLDTAKNNSKSYKGKYPGPDRFKGDQGKIAAWKAQGKPSSGTTYKKTPIGNADGSTTAGNGNGKIDDAVPPQRQGSGSIYTVKRGDNLTKIAKSHGTDLKTVLKNNPSLRKNPNLIYRGTKVRFK